MATFNVATEALIEEVKNRPALWDSTTLAYADRFQRKRSWEEVVEALVENYLQLSEQDKVIIVEGIRKRWKNIRDCFLREVRERKSAFSANRFRKSEYAHFKQLMFLAKSIDGVDVDFTEIPVDMNFTAQTPTKSTTVRKRKKVDIKVEAESGEMESDIEVEPEIENYAFELHDVDGDNSSKIDENSQKDEDKMFLLSLVSAMKKIPESDKIATRIKILGIIEEAQGKSNKGWPYN